MDWMEVIPGLIFEVVRPERMSRDGWPWGRARQVRSPSPPLLAPVTMTGGSCSSGLRARGKKGAGEWDWGKWGGGV